MKRFKLKKRFVFKPIHFLLLLAIDVCVLAGVLIPQQTQLNDAREELLRKQEERTDAQLRYTREMDNLEFMRTTRYKLQQGSIKYGWHFSEDTLIPDSITPTPGIDTSMRPIGTPVPQTTLAPVPRSNP